MSRSSSRIRKVKNYFAESETNSDSENLNGSLKSDDDEIVPKKKPKNKLKASKVSAKVSKASTKASKPTAKASKPSKKANSYDNDEDYNLSKDDKDDSSFDLISDEDDDVYDIVPTKKAKKVTKKEATLPLKSKNKQLKEEKKALKKVNDENESESESESSDWEEVEDTLYDSENYQPSVPENLKVNLDPKAAKSKKEVHWTHWTRLRMNKLLKKWTLNMQRANILIFMSHLKFMNTVINSDQLRALALSITSLKVHKFKGKVDKFIEVVYGLVSQHFTTLITINKGQADEDLVSQITKCYQKRAIESTMHMALIVASIIRLHGYYVRVCATMDFIPFKPKDLITKDTKFTRVTDPKASTSTSNLDAKKLSNIIYWIEVYDDAAARWVYSELTLDKKITIPKKLSYAFAVDKTGCIIDVTIRYAKDFFTKEIKNRRNDDDWYKETLKIVHRQQVPDKYHDADIKEFDNLMSELALPTRLTDYKNHPVFILKNHLLKFQAIYPPNAPPVGFFRDEPVYSRNCVHTLKSRETWLKEARQIKLNEVAYKTTTPRFKKKSGELLNLYGEWQTMPYQPPVAKNGIVPRNAYGNVDLFKECMLPIGTVHLRLPGLARIANKLKIDIAEAMIGYDVHQKAGGAHPVFDGFIVCKEFKDILVDAWKEENRIFEQKREAKREKIVLDRWKRLIKGVILRHRLKIKYG